MRLLRKLRDTASLYRRWAEAEFSTCSQKLEQPAGHHLLILAQVLPPFISGGVYRPTSWLRFGEENGWRVSAVGPALSNEITGAGEYLKETIPENQIIIYAPEARIKPAWRFSPKVEGGFLPALQMYRAAKKHFQNDPPSVVIASGPSFFSFIAGMWTAKYFGAKFVLDYRDEWTECPFDFVKKTHWDPCWEKRCHSHADNIFFTTEAMRRHQLGAFHALSFDKCFVHPNGWDSTDLSEIVKGPILDKPKGLNYLTFIGNLTDYVLPEEFLATFARLLAEKPGYQQNFGLHFVGLQSPNAAKAIKAFPFPTNIKVEGMVAKPEAERLSRESFALLTLTSPALSRYRPGKVIEYLASDRPILVYGCKGEVSDIVSELGAGEFVTGGDVKALDAALEKFSGAAPEQWHSKVRQFWAEENNRRALAKDFFASLNKLVQPASD